MKNQFIYIFPIIILVNFIGYTQSVGHNYVKTIELLEPVGINAFISNPGNFDKIEFVTYLDGFGKTKQSIAIKQTPNEKDMLQHIEYDQFGRASKQYLPLPTNQSNGNYINNAQSQISTYYQNEFSDQHPFSEVRYDNSPLNRKLEETGPGNTWELLSTSDNDHTNKFEYDVNEENEVLLFEINETDPSIPLDISYFDAEELLKNVIKNENWTSSDGSINTKEVFTDKNGRKIAEFSYEYDDNNNVKKFSTYYVFDNIGNLRYVLTPKILQKVQATDVDNYAVQWLENDFLSEGDAGSLLVNFKVSNNVVSFYAKRLSGGPTLGGNNKTIASQTTKILNTSSPIPDIVLGPVNGVTGHFLGGPVISQIGTASIVNGNLVVDRFLNGQYSTLQLSLSKDLGILPLSQQMLDDLAFQYKYDEFNRQIEQKVPGKGWEYMIYDQLDRPILTQDPNLREDNEWLFNKYDVFGRVVYSGKYTNSASRSGLQTQVDNFINASNNKSNIVSRVSGASNIGGLAIYYTNDSFPNTSLETLTVSYYDNYLFLDPSFISLLPTHVLGQEISFNAKGLLTATKTKTLGGNTWSNNYTFYDKKGRVILVLDQNYLGGYTQNKSKLDFRGKIILSETEHQRDVSSPVLKIVDNFEYDDAERTTKHYQKINSQPNELISSNTYNELGQLEQKDVGGTNLTGPGLQTIDYDYNIRGWLTNINDVNNLGPDLFAYNLRYDESHSGTAVPDQVYNGNIRQVIWKSAKNNTKKGYVYRYDKLSRLKASYYRLGNTLTDGAAHFETYNLKYDANGNIETLGRNNQSGSQIDNLTYNYDTGNKLLSIDDTTNNSIGFNDGSSSSNDYDYDLNGNLIKDLNKGISNIEYNHLDLVERVTFSSGAQIDFLYDANGAKLSKEISFSGPVPPQPVSYYLGGFEHEDGYLKFFPTPEGYAYNDNGTFKYVYQFKDHLGNNRVSYTDSDNSNDTNASEIISNTDYYAMGLTHHGEYISGFASNHNYKYQGKELLDFNGYNMYDFGSRMYDASVGRWFNTDPQNQFHSPYLAMGNNPVTMVDPDGELAFLAIVGIAAAIGGISGGIAAKDMGYSTFGGIWRGALVGAAAGSAGAGIAAAGGGVLLSGAAGGAVGGGGFSGIATKWDTDAVLEGAIKGLFSGMVGAGVAASVGGGAGAFFGGTASDLTNQALSHGNINLYRAGLSGGIGLGLYQMNTYLSYRTSSLKGTISFKQFGKISADFQRSKFWRKEYGGIATSDGSIIRAPSKYRHNLGVDFDPAWTNSANGKGDILFHYHTHWAKAGISYNVNSNYDFASNAEIASGNFVVANTVNGPSTGDRTFSQNNSKFAGLVVGRSNDHFYYNSNINFYSKIFPNINFIKKIYNLPFWFKY